MASILRKKIVRWIDRTTQKRTTPHAPNYKRIAKKSTYYYAKGVPGYPRGYLVPLRVTDKESALAKLKKLVRKQERRAQGIEGPEVDHADTPLSQHIEDYERYLRASGSTAHHIAAVVARIRRLCDACGFQFIADISMSKTKEFAASLAASKKAVQPLEPGKEWYTRKDAMHALGVSPSNLKQLLRRHQLPVVGNNHARRYPRATVEFLWQRRQLGSSPATRNFYIRSAKSFCRWMVRDGRMVTDPLQHIEGENAETDVRRGRRTLLQDEARRLLLVTRASATVFRGLTGPDRAMVYQVALGTGFREAELAALVVARFHLDGRTPSVELPAREGKNRKPVTQPIGLELAQALRHYLTGRMPTDPIFPGTWSASGAEMLRNDLQAAGIPFAVEGPDGPLYVDFHSLRHTFIAEMDRAGLPLKHAMQLARHSDPKLTLKRYGRAQQEELAASINRLAPLTASVPIGTHLAELQALTIEELHALALVGLLALHTTPHLYRAD